MLHQKLVQKTKIQTPYTNQISDLEDCNIYIITVPTPIYKNKKPNLSMIKDVTNTVSKVVKKKILLYWSQLFIQVLLKMS